MNIMIDYPTKPLRILGKSGSIFITSSSVNHLAGPASSVPLSYHQLGPQPRRWQKNKTP